MIAGSVNGSGTLRIAMPVTVISAIGAASKLGVVVKSQQGDGPRAAPS
ncbi:hypothetical protein AS96_15050 [Microbacterium sp. MRS-1]|nr:hypothetical protein AS96_15050 [Microbacterium sp. MRS-1]